MEETVKLVKMLAARHKTVACAESCTAGMIAAEIASVPGASNVFEAGIVSYSERIKEKFLGVSAGTIAKNGVVSSETAAEMADGVLRRADADIAVAVTGFAGPGGGTPESPVGTVWIAVATADGSDTRRFAFEGDRQQVRERTVAAAIVMLTEGTEKYL